MKNITLTSIMRQVKKVLLTFSAITRKASCWLISVLKLRPMKFIKFACAFKNISIKYEYCGGRRMASFQGIFNTTYSCKFYCLG